MENKNAPAHEAEGVVCQLGGDTDALTTTSSPLQQRPTGTLHLRPNSDKMEAALKAQVNEWDIGRRIRGMRPDRRISKDEAGRLLRLALQAMEVPS